MPVVTFKGPLPAFIEKAGNEVPVKEISNPVPDRKRSGGKL
ncbi:MAG TPA: hypothetical protein PLJ84_04950 [Bacteroidales bacterium]|nr:hypothetical protein [Bacteroidales bacterium]HPT01926.1 hypothetical protein [Bacteroidales bacterium]